MRWQKYNVWIVVGVFLVIAWYRYVHLPTDDVFVRDFVGKKNVTLEGLVSDEPEDRGTGVRFPLRIESTTSVPVVSDLLVTAPPYTDVSYGDRVHIKAIVKKPDVIVSDNGDEFDYPAWLRVQGVFYTAKTTSVEVLSSGNGSAIKSALIKLKSWFETTVTDRLSEPYGLLANGLVVAGKGALGKDLQEEFKRAGLIHIVVLSGFNVSIIGQAILGVFSFLPGVLGIVCGSFGIVGFAIMTGGSPPVVRSAIMSIIALFAHATGRTYDALKGLLIACLFSLIVNPLVLLHDPSFQLSAVSTLGLILLGTPISRFLKWLPEKYEIRGLVSSTLATQIFVTPFLLKLSGNVSLVALGANLLVLPLIPFTMLMVFLIVISSFIPLISLPFVFVSYLLLSYELGVVHWFASLPFAMVTLEKAPSWWTVLFIYLTYVIIFFLFKRLQSKHQQNVFQQPQS